MTPNFTFSHKIFLPEFRVDSSLAEAIHSAAKSWGLEGIEDATRRDALNEIDLIRSPEWLSFSSDIGDAYRAHDHVVVRGLPVTEDGAAFLLATMALGRSFRTYRGGQIVKKFSMSPWTKDLSHTTRKGDFHTDLNTASEPPVLTAIQCLLPDPGAPKYGQNRVARMSDLLDCLEVNGQHDVLQLLRDARVTMSNGSGQDWSGAIVVDGSGSSARIPPLRYHPSTLRAATSQALESAELETMIGAVHEAAIAASIPFDLASGDTLFVSNHRALHYRGECSVKFTRFPTEYQARQIFVLHLMEEPR
mgnify:CR=1 FL=1